MSMAGQGKPTLSRAGWQLRVCIAIGALLASSAALASDDFEEPPVLRAADVVESDLLVGEHHRVDERVENDGVMNHFVVLSDFGEFKADSETMLKIRIREIEAIAKLQEISQTEAFSEALQAAALKPIDAAEQIVTKPVETVKAVPGGINRAARGLFYKSRKVAHQVKEAVDKEDEEEDEPATAAEETAESNDGSTKKAIEKGVQDQIGYSRARRDLAARLRVDPYSSNEVLQRELSRLAKGAFAGGLTFRFTMPAVNAIGYVEDVTALVWTVSPDELERRNNKALAEMGVPKAVRLDLFESSVWSTTLETALVAALSQLEGVAGRERFVALAVSSEGLQDARRLVLSVALLAKYHATTPLARLEVVSNDNFGELIAGATESGRYVLPGAVDYLIWQEGMSGGSLELVRDKELLLSGDLSERARSELEARGWKIQTDVLVDMAF